ncbi:TfoX/Sxy family protein [Isobaculum melis]|uniref:DNA transformation protein n=1 Tax=Isobaculum melis TaxID=142588 RepID=A0A1H9S9F3_9LACT|nr:TfoX/Sxy family protein [Isobaculum melis]SER81225.1 DNA transformation protein [Isobaculum melis]
MNTLTTLPNIGKELERKLKSVGITSVDELKALGSERAFLKLKHQYSNVCLVHLYCLQGAIDSIAYDQLSADLKIQLKKFSDSLKTA